MKKILMLLLVVTSFIYAKRLVVLEPSAVEIMYKLQAQDQIIAIAKMLNSKIYPEEQTSKLPSVGNYSKPNIEKIVALKPDLVIANQYSANLEQDLNRFNIKTISLKANSINDIYKNIEKIGEIAEKQKEAKALVQELKDRLAKMNKEKLKGKKAVFFYSQAPLMAFNSKTLPGDILKILGLIDISDKLEGERPIINQEYILQENPDFIITLKGMGNTDDILKINPLLKKTKAGKNNAIYFVPSSGYLRGTYRIFDAIEDLHKILIK